MLVALVIALASLFGVAGLIANVVVATYVVDMFGNNTQWGAGYFVAGGFVTLVASWPSLLLFSEPKDTRLIITGIVAAVVYILPVLIVLSGKVRCKVRQRFNSW